MRRRVFIGSAGEAMKICRAVQQELDREFDATIWDQGVFRPTESAIDSLGRALHSSDAGVFVLTPEDSTERRGRVDPTARDNVIFELGMFLGHLGRDHTFMLAPRNVPMLLPSDLTGITVVYYDAARFDREPQAAVGAACTKIAQALNSTEPEISPEPRFRGRLDRALTRMSTDLEALVLPSSAGPEGSADPVSWPGAVAFEIEQARIQIAVGRIENCHPIGERQVIVLPANEYFDDGCINDATGTLGAFVARHFADRIPYFKEQIAAELAGSPTWRVRRSARRVAESHGIGQTILLNGLRPEHHLMLVSCTTERDGVGLHAEPHFIYAALEGIVETMNEYRFNSLILPVLGSGHGEISLPAAVLFNLLALRSALAGNSGRHVKDVRFVVFDGDTARLSGGRLRDVLAKAAPGSVPTPGRPLTG